MGPVGPLEDEIWPNHGLGVDAQKVNTKQTKNNRNKPFPSHPSALINTKSSYRQISMKRWG
jgi:hypothetical protein